jgi:hypothetical protein
MSAWIRDLMGPLKSTCLLVWERGAEVVSSSTGICTVSVRTRLGPRLLKGFHEPQKEKSEFLRICSNLIAVCTIEHGLYPKWHTI